MKRYLLAACLLLLAGVSLAIAVSDTAGNDGKADNVSPGCPGRGQCPLGEGACENCNCVSCPEDCEDCPCCENCPGGCVNGAEGCASQCTGQGTGQGEGQGSCQKDRAGAEESRGRCGGSSCPMGGR